MPQQDHEGRAWPAPLAGRVADDASAEQIAEAITLEQWSQRPLHLRLQEWFAGLWEYWL